MSVFWIQEGLQKYKEDTKMEDKREFDLRKFNPDKYLFENVYASSNPGFDEIDLRTYFELTEGLGNGP